MKRGLIVGKFYPPHKGHKYLIDVASSQVDALVVAVCERSDQKISGAQRAAWIKEIHPNVEVRVIQDIMKDDDSSAWADYTRKFLGYTPDVVFSSEDYGETYARYLGCEHVLVDKARIHVPISATKIRSDALQYLDFLEPCVKAYFAKRVCVVGAESTGTTTLAKSLAKHYKTVWAPEFGRMYWEGKMHSAQSVLWNTDEFRFIAATQNSIEDYLARHCERLVVCDTNAFATSLWHERYLGTLSKDVEAIGAARSYDMYILTGDEIPFVQDGTRDGEHVRHNMHRRFEEELQKRGLPYVVLTGSPENRMKAAIRECDRILHETVRL